MSSKQLLRLAAVLALVLVLWGAVALASRRTAGRDAEASIIPKVDPSKVDTVTIMGPRDTAILVRTSDKATPWRVNGHPADTQVVKELLDGLKDPQSPAELVARNPSSHARLQVSEDSGKKVRVVERGRTVLTLVAGKATVDGEGVYVRRAGEPAVYDLEGGVARALSRRIEDWRDHMIRGVSSDSVGAVEIRRGNRSYTLRRNAGRWAFSTGAKADSAAVAGLLSSYREIRAAQFATEAQKDSLRFTKPRRTARLLDRNGAPLMALAFDSIASGIWVRVTRGPNSGDRGQGATEPFRIDTWTADQLTPADTTLRKK